MSHSVAPGAFDSEFELQPFGSLSITYDVLRDVVTIQTIDFVVGQTSVDVPLEAFNEDQVAQLQEQCELEYAESLLDDPLEE
jgi:hypothetical protein